MSPRRSIGDLVRRVFLVAWLSLSVMACTSQPEAANSQNWSGQEPTSLPDSPTPMPDSPTPTPDSPTPVPQQEPTSAPANPTPPPAGSLQDETGMPVVPLIRAADKDRLRAVYLAGQAAGNHPAVFAKVGDSITWLSFFLKDEIGCGVDRMDSYADLLPTVEYFRTTTFDPSYTDAWCGIANSYTRDSVTAIHSWTAADALDPARLDPVPAGCSAPYNTPLTCELHLIKPSIALIMYGTNDLFLYNDLDMYRANLTQIVTEVLDAGVIPVLSTIPPRLDDPALAALVAPHNQVIIEVAQAQQIPLWNYWLALQDSNMVDHGLGPDGVHPNYALDGTGGDYGAAIFTPEGLRYGFNQRNLTAIQVLDKIKRVVMDDGAPDAEAACPSGCSIDLASGSTECCETFVPLTDPAYEETL